MDSIWESGLKQLKKVQYFFVPIKVTIQHYFHMFPLYVRHNSLISFNFASESELVIRVVVFCHAKEASWFDLKAEVWKGIFSEQQRKMLGQPIW